MILRALALAGLPSFALLLAGCGVSHDVTGTIAGKSLTFQDEISGQLVDGTSNLTVVELSSVSGVCAALGAGQKSRSAQALTLSLSQGGGNAVAPGVFPVSPAMSGAGPAAIVEYTETSGGCLTTAQVHGLSGSVTLASVSGGAVSGTADVTLDTDEHITFAFSTTACSALAVAASPTTCP